MISRRNIRIKVLQSLYATNSFSKEEKKKKLRQARKQVDQSIKNSEQILFHLLYFAVKIAEYAETDAEIKASKHLRTEADLKVSTKISFNTYIGFIKANEDFQDAVKKFKLEIRTDKDLVRQLYHAFTPTEGYQAYVQQEENNPEADKAVIAALFNDFLLLDEDFNQYMEENYLEWEDDIVLMQMLLSNYLNAPKSFSLSPFLTRETADYAEELLTTVIEKEEYCMEWIKPRLKNWDPDRLAVIDMLLLQMGVSEFLYFPTIPPRATMNEYIDLAKYYSTPQSSQFINGVLDNILKALKKEKKLNKTARAMK